MAKKRKPQKAKVKKAKQLYPPHRREVVVWRDANFPQGTSAYFASEIDPICELCAIGFVMGEKAGYLMLAGEVGREDGRYRHITNIPLVNIVRRKRI